MKVLLDLSRQDHQEILDRIKSMSLAHSLEQKKDIEATIKSGSEIFEGIPRIMKFLDELSGELHHWYFCHC